MGSAITLEMMSNIQNWLGRGVIVAFCDSEKNIENITRREECISFKNIKSVITDLNLNEYIVFRIDTLGDKMCLYVTKRQNDSCNCPDCKGKGKLIIKSGSNPFPYAYRSKYNGKEYVEIAEASMYVNCGLCHGTGNVSEEDIDPSGII